MFKHILIPTDGSPTANRAVKAGIKFAHEIGAKVTGYHAIEFLLWGQDTDPNGPGDRPYTDYVTGEGGTSLNQDRRALYLTTTSNLLLGHLETLTEAWSPDSTSNYRASFVADEPASARAWRDFTRALGRWCRCGSSGSSPPRARTGLR